MVAFESTARETYARFRKADSFVASGSPFGQAVEGSLTSAGPSDFGPAPVAGGQPLSR
jgi:single-strand DNA-binding protein